MQNEVVDITISKHYKSKLRLPYKLHENSRYIAYAITDQNYGLNTSVHVHSYYNSVLYGVQIYDTIR
jgi:hypothetical protein